MIFHTYKEYKDSGIDWLPQIPKEWSIERLKNLGPLQNGVSKGADYFGKGNPFVNYVNVYNDTINIKSIKNLANSTKSDQKNYSVKENDVFFTRTSETVEEIGYSGTCLKTIPKAVFSGFIIRLRANPKLITKEFSKYFFKAESNRNFFIKEMNIVTRASLSQGILNKFSVLLPQKEIQSKITNYLDTKIPFIDEKIELLRKKKESYIDLKQTIIIDLVSKGMDNTTKMKESEIEWIGKMPNHWNIQRLKDNVVCFNGGAFKDSLVDKGLPIIKIKQLVSNSPAIEFCNPNSLKINKKNTLRSGDLLFSWSTLLYPFIYEGDNAVLNQHIFKLKYSKNLDKRFLYYKLISAVDIFKSLAHGSTMKHIMKSDFDNLNYSHPPKKEQIEIANYLDEKSEKIDNIIKTIDKNIQILKEFRKTLINDTVTGKIKIA